MAAKRKAPGKKGKAPKRERAPQRARTPAHARASKVPPELARAVAPTTRARAPAPVVPSDDEIQRAIAEVEAERERLPRGFSNSLHWRAALWQRLERCEELRASAMSTSRLTLALMTEFGVTRREARRCQALVELRARERAAMVGIEGRLSLYRDIGLRLVNEAFQAKASLYKGKDADGSPQYEVVTQPDVRAGAAALKSLIALEGVPSSPDESGAPGFGTRPGAKLGAGLHRPRLVAQVPEVTISTDELTAELVKRIEGGEAVP